MTRLNQIIAVEKGVKSKAFQTITETHHKLQKQALLAGISRTYRPKDEEGEQLPPESTRVQLSVSDAIADIRKALAELFDVTATKEWANCKATANVEVDGRTLLEDVPVTYLLFLEKQLTDLHTFVKKLPVLDPADSWEFDENVGFYATEPVETVRTKKVPRVLVKAVATEKHPAQTEVYYEDVPVGYWRTVKFSGAMPAARVGELLARIERLQQSVKVAREEANNGDVTAEKLGDQVFAYLFD
jgi:hypothetical protein